MKYLIQILFGLLVASNLYAQTNSEPQPFIFQSKRLIEALDYLGTPISAKDKSSVEKIVDESHDAKSAGPHSASSPRRGPAAAGRGLGTTGWLRR